MIFLPTQQNIKRAAETLRQGGVVAFPTETVYGLGADATNDSAVKLVFSIKGRPSTDPLIVHLGSLSQVSLVSNLNSDPKNHQRLEKLSSFWPGPLSIVLPKSSSIPDSVSAGLNTVAVRIPNHPVALELIKLAEKPIAAPSANPFGYVSPTSAKHVADSLGDKVSLILDGGDCTVGIESTVLSLCEDVPTILRPGAITKEMIEQKLQEPVILKSAKISSTQPAPAPGMLYQHYSPRTQIGWLSEHQGKPLPARVGVIQFTSSQDRSIESATTRLVLSEDGTLDTIASRLFAALRELDRQNLELILIDSCLEQGIGVAIMDRVRRAIG